MSKRVAVLAFALILMLIAVSAAYDVTKDDFIQPPSVTVVINKEVVHPNLQNNVLFVNHACYGGEKVNVVYVIKPSSPSLGTTIAGRSYTITTQLIDNEINYFAFRYDKEHTLMSAYPSNGGKDSVTLNLPSDWQYGYGEINITVKGKIPQVNKRFVELKVLSVDVQGGAPDCLPPVVIPVVNKEVFKSDLDSAKNTYNQLYSELNKYLGQVDTSDLSKDLKLANSNLTSAETLYNNEDYIKANEKLNTAENWLNKAKEDLKKVEAEYYCKEVQDKANEIFNTINEISAYIDEINSGAVKLSISEKIKIKAQFNEIQNDYSNLQASISAIKAAINNGLYDDAIAKAKNAMDSANKTYIKAENLLNQLESKIAKPKETSTSSKSSLPSISINRTVLAIIVGVIVAVVIIALILYMRGGGRFDELR